MLNTPIHDMRFLQKNMFLRADQGSLENKSKCQNPNAKSNPNA
jgi:hypothetical protein